MATTGKINGTDWLMYFGGTAISHSTSCSISLVMDTIDSTTKDSDGWADNLESLRSWSGSADAAIALDAAEGMEETFNLIQTRASVVIKFATSDAADQFFTGTARITGLDANAEHEGLATWTVSFVGNGRLDFVTT